VVGKDGKKLWELLLCDASGNFKHVERIPSNMVNSREVRKAVERVIDDVSGRR
jgi:RNA-binding protein Tab2/Atab2